MNIRTSIATAAIAAMAATTASANSLTFQNVSFEMIALDSNTLQLSIGNALNATGDWAGIAYLKAFELKDIGTVSGGTLAGWSNSNNALGAGGCLNGNTNGGCFTHIGGPLALSNAMVFTIDFASGSLDLNGVLPTLDVPQPADPFPHLKTVFTTTFTGRKTGSLLSQPIPSVPEPETYALMLAGLGVVAFMGRRRKAG